MTMTVGVALVLALLSSSWKAKSKENEAIFNKRAILAAVKDHLGGMDPKTMSDEEVLDFVPQLLAILKSPMGIASSAVFAIGLITVVMLTSGGMQMFDSPKLDADREIAGIERTEDAELVAEKEAADETAEDKSSGDASPDEEEKSNTYQDQYGWVSFSSDGSIYHTAPTTISLLNGNVTAELTLSVGIVVERDAATQLLGEGLAVNVMKIETAQSIDIGPYLAWEVPGLITKGLKQRIEAEYPDIAVEGILIRDFELT